MTTCPVGGGRGDLTYVATANSVNLLKLIPIEFQVTYLYGEGKGIERESFSSRRWKLLMLCEVAWRAALK